MVHLAHGPSSIMELSSLRRRFGKSSSSQSLASSASKASKEASGAPLEVRRPLFSRHCREERLFGADYVEQKQVVLGTGINGEVTQAICRTTGRAVAVKSFDKKALSEKKRLQLKSEVDVHLQSDHPHIVRLERVYETDSEVKLVMEKLEGGELFDQLQKHSHLEEQRVAKLIRQCLLAIAYLHDRGVIHRDVKMENLVFDRKDSQDHIKLLDFGFAQRWDGSNELFERCGTLHYLAPEVLQGRYGNKCDIWSVGVVAYMLLTGKCPYHGEDEAVRHKVQLGKIDVSRGFLKLSQATQDFVRSLLTADPKARPSAKQLLEHPWLQRWDGEAVPAAPPCALLRQLIEASKQPRARRAGLALVAWCLPPEAEASVYSQFAALDADNDGVISLSDLQAALLSTSLGSRREAAWVMQALDADGSGTLSFREILAAAGPAREAAEDVLRAAFLRFDEEAEECSTTTKLGGLTGLLGGLFGGMDEKELAEAFAPGRRDGQVGFAEFRTYLRKKEMHSHIPVWALGPGAWPGSWSPRTDKGSLVKVGCSSQAAGLLRFLELFKALRSVWRYAAFGFLP
eukprot:TRINITY_DN18994_c0_g1_i2.p1 TRINITY_DN18994_c0_g1~~TRINITY_DN18994_c0_g1_i2.p1  ORF type:complete len:586 (-),score=132.71 TRINITY_DN18994_c0_g1_i2:108-1820(-)